MIHQLTKQCCVLKVNIAPLELLRAQSRPVMLELSTHILEPNLLLTAPHVQLALSAMIPTALLILLYVQLGNTVPEAPLLD